MREPIVMTINFKRIDDYGLNSIIMTHDFYLLKRPLGDCGLWEVSLKKLKIFEFYRLETLALIATS
jgi:hypothetical protein